MSAAAREQQKTARAAQKARPLIVGSWPFGGDPARPHPLGEATESNEHACSQSSDRQRVKGGKAR